jgi:hypothetical protein
MPVNRAASDVAVCFALRLRQVKPLLKIVKTIRFIAFNGRK